MSEPVRSMPDWYYIIGPDGLRTVRHSTRSVARAWLFEHYPQLTHDQMGAVLELAGADPDKQTAARFDPHQKLFVTAAWLCGASTGQLSTMFGVTRQTIFDKMNREMPRAQRNAVRLAHELPDWRLEGMREQFYKLLDTSPSVYAGLNALEVARFLLAVPVTTEPDVDAEDALGLPDVDRRIGE